MAGRYVLVRQDSTTNNTGIENLEETSGWVVSELIFASHQVTKGDVE